jgi:hypothetical protein
MSLFTDNEIDLYNKYMDYLKEEYGDINWSCKSKWTIVMKYNKNKEVPVITFHQWRIMIDREEKLNKLLGD